MKSRIVIGACLALSVVFVLTAGLLTEKATKDPEAVSSETPLTDGYLLREYDGMIGVFEVGKDKPISVINVDLCTLPENDRNALCLGIYAADAEELNRRIEDFSS